MNRLSSISTGGGSYYSFSPSSARYSAHFGAPLPPTEIIPRLYLADLSAAETGATLTALGITHVLSAMAGVVNLPQGMPLKRLQLPFQDTPFAELADHLPRTTAFIADALRDPHARVLVHCVEGISRSSSVVCAFLIAQYGWTPAQAVQYVKSKRSHADPNPGFVSQLGEYADKLRGGSRRR